MLNNQAGTKKVRDQVLSEINTRFEPLLDDHLNHENLIRSANISYNYNGIYLQINNYAKDFYLSNGETKGLEVFLIFGLNSSTENCTSLPTKFDEEKYGGIQEVYTFSVVRSMMVAALEKGLFNHVIGYAWDVPSFQFRMGDLGNFFPYANK